MTTMRVVGECFFWYRLTRVFPDKFHRAVKRLCVVFFSKFLFCLQCFDTVGWAAGRASGLNAEETECCGAGMVICLGRSADLHMAQLMPLLLTVTCFSKVQIGFTFLVSAHPGNPGQNHRAVEQLCVCYYFMFY